MKLSKKNTTSADEESARMCQREYGSFMKRRNIFHPSHAFVWHVYYNAINSPKDLLSN